MKVVAQTLGDPLRLTFVFEKDGDHYCAYCEELGTASSGEDIPTAIEMIADATALYIRTLRDLEEERELKESG